MLYTKRELATEMLRRIRVVGLLEPAPAEVLTRVGAIYDSKLHEWRDRGLVYWENTDGFETAEIPGGVYETLVQLLINVGESQFGKNVQISQLDRNAIEDRLLRSLRRHTHMQSARLPAQVDYF